MCGLAWLAAALIAAACAAPLAPISVPTPAPTAEVAHDFTLPALTGPAVTLRDLRGRWVVVNFWATWCAPCRAEMPYLQEIATEYAAQVTVLGVNMREDAEEVARFVGEAGIAFPVLLEPDDAMLLWYGPRGLPLTYVIAPDGTVAYKQFGPLAPATFDAWLAQHVAP